jgi:hypothetical protein
LVRGILENRLGQQQLQYNEISDAIKQQQAKQAGNQALPKAASMGLADPGTLSGTGAAGFKNYAEMAALLRQKQDADAMDVYRKALSGEAEAHGNVFQKTADYLDQYNQLPGRGGGASGGNTVPLPDANGDPTLDANGRVIMVSPNSVLYRNAMQAQHPSLRPPTSPTQAKAYLSAVGVSGPDAFNSAQQQGLQRQPDGTLKPLTQDQTYEDDATDVKITPSGGGSAVTVPKSVLENIKRQLMPGSYTDDTQPNASPPVDVPPGGGTFPPNFSGFPPSASPPPPPAGTSPQGARVPPNAATGAPVNTPTPFPPLKPLQPGQRITPNVVNQYLIKNNNDPDAARQNAAADGWTF